MPLRLERGSGGGRHAQDAAGLSQRGVNGVELVRSATAHHPALKAITMSGYAWSELVQARRLPPDAHFLRKPFHNAELLRLVGEVLAG